MRVVLICLTAVLLSTHPLWLRFLGQSLVAEDFADAGEADVLLLLNADHSIEFACKSLQSDPRQSVVLQQVAPRRLQCLGVLDGWDKTAQGQLVSRGISISRVQIVSGQPSNYWQEARVINNWLRERPNCRVAVLCDRLNSASQAELYSIVMDADVRNRISIVALADRRYDETNWWKSAVGIKAFFGASFSRVLIATRGEEHPRPVDWDPDKYESTLVKCIFNEP